MKNWRPLLYRWLFEEILCVHWTFAMTGTVTGVLGKGSSHRMGNDTVSGWLVWMRRPPGLMSSTRPRMVFLVDLGRPTGDSSRPTNSLLTGNLRCSRLSGPRLLVIAEGSYICQ